MSAPLQYVLVDGIKCYGLEEAAQYTDYLDDGFDVTDKLEADSFWVRSRNRLLITTDRGYGRILAAPQFLEIGYGLGACADELGDAMRIQV